jgi:hypothetical protein
MEDRQTAVEWLYERLERMIPRDALYNMDKKEYFKQAKQMEKEQIIDARANGFISSAEGWNGEVPCMKWTEVIRETKCEEYYNETYNK